MMAAPGVLLEITAYSAALYGAIWLLRRLLGDTLSPRLKYALWFLVVARLLLPVTVASPLHLPRIPQAEAGSLRQAAAADIAAAGNGAAASGDAEPAGRAPTAAATEPAAAAPANPAASPLVLHVGWPEAFFWIWLTGAAAMLLRFLVLSLRMRRRIRRECSDAPDGLNALLGGLCRGMGLRGRPELLVARWGGSPCLTASLRPRLLLPAGLLERLDRRQLAFALAHELTHYRRGDHLMCLVLNLLRCVHWFNPFAWLTAREMQEDMETACDGDVVAALREGDRRRYAETLLMLISSGRRQALALGMAGGGAKEAAERRIRGVFARRQSRRGARWAAAALALVMLLACFTTACQPTPSKPPVVRKDQDYLKATPSPQAGGAEGSAAGGTAQPAEPLAGQVAAPEKYTADLAWADGKLKLTADAAVAVPNVTAAPVLRVQAADFTQAQADGLIRALFKGRPLYEFEQGRLSKEEIDEQILNYKRMKASDEYKSEGDQRSLDETIEKLRQARADAPDKRQSKIVPSEGKLHPVERLDQFGKHMYNYTGVSLTTNPDGGIKGAQNAETLWIENNNDLKEAVVYTNDSGVVTGMQPVRRNAMAHYYRIDDAHASVSYSYDTAAPVDEAAGITDAAVKALLKLTPADARKQAGDFLAAAGMSDMAVYAIQLVNDGYDNDARPVTPTHCAYRVLITRTAGGFLCPWLNGLAGNTDEKMKDMLSKGQSSPDDAKYAADWYYETASLLLDDTGIVAFDWSSPLAVTDTAQEKASLLGFSEIRQRFEEQIRYAYEPQAREKNVDGIDIKVTAVRLELQRISERDAIGSGLLVPVWNFYGTRLIRYAGDAGEQPESDLLMTVNAIDGSVIDRNLGY